MINTRDDRGSGEEERSEAKTDFGGLKDAESKDHRGCEGGRGEQTRGWDVGVQRNK